ncbi:hypothetical protein [Agrococcus sp. SGAir0287]|uniref:hypothetical protein n=1 Tax=Agrococcus sp. SGAir0287 TaxID=2070347 RepID=UPI0010CD24DA|nr:hypothetical protein [Agrococcus sp. SGAir0287]QCR20460.1 hypothetical protein C1N71_14270 [Agrococcus sp. SGAir0287]
MTTRSRTIQALAAVALLPALFLAGCASDEESTPSTTATASAQPSAAPSAEASQAPAITPGATAEMLAGTSWFGTAEGVAEVTFTFGADGTVDFTSFNGDPSDVPGDVWSVDGSTLTLTMSQLQSPSGAIVDIVFTGTAATGGMELTGTDGTGATYAMTIVQL